AEALQTTLTGQLVVTQSITDADGDTATSGGLDIATGGFFSIDDDGPAAFVPDHAHLVLAVDEGVAVPQTITQSLNFLAGTDGLGDVVFTQFNVEPEGQLFKSSEGKQLYLGNELLYIFYVVVDGVPDMQQLEARTLDGDVAFTAEIDAIGDVSITVFSGILLTDSQLTTVTDLSGVGGGNVPFKGLNIEDGSDGSDDVLVSSEIGTLGGDASSVNSNATVLGVGQGNEISAGERIRYDLVTDLAVDDTQNSESYTFSGYQETFVFTQKIVITGGGKDADFILRIYAQSDGIEGGTTTLVEGQGGSGQLWLSASEVQIFDAGGSEQFGHVSDNGDGSVTVSNMLGDWTFKIISVVDPLALEPVPEAFNAIEIEAIVGATGTTSFKLGEFSFGAESDIDPVTFNLPVTGFDADGDSVESQIDVTVYPDTKSVVGSDGIDDVLEGLDGADDYIFGLDGADTLSGLGGDDILFGGQDNDTLTGAEGSDTFMWVRGDEGTGATDIVTDFTVGSGGDTLNLADLLQGETAAGTGTLDDYLTVTFSGGDTTITADIDGGGSGSTTQTIVLQGVDLTDPTVWGGVITDPSLSSTQVIDNLLANNNLITD
ncbi:MAG: type I secretion C-terminal target domain-containing protein, partial [Pseudomonadota bacterium]|nr:type I secretion C-terminal target domain-containing protein [Pseudomonadota bacterium]